MMLRKPGPLTSIVPGKSDNSALIASATSRGLRRRRLARLIATFAWKSANWEGRISGSASACSGPNARASACWTRSVSTICGSVMV